MTRINLVPPIELYRTHLQGEYYELPRVLTGVRKAIARGKTPQDYAHFTEFKFGGGHVLFFYSRLHFVCQRYTLIYQEMIRRGYSPNRQTIVDLDILGDWYGHWTPTEADIQLSRDRLHTRLLSMGVSPLTLAEVM